MATYPKGNQYYKLRLRTGANKKYTASKLFKSINEYFEAMDNNPFMESQVVARPWVETITEEKTGENGELITVTRTLNHTHAIIEIPKRRPYTFLGLCNHLNISTETFKNYQGDADKFEVCTQARMLIEQHQYEGAASGFFKEQIVARMLGLTDKKDVTTNGEAIAQVTIFQLPDNGRNTPEKTPDPPF